MRATVSASYWLPRSGASTRDPGRAEAAGRRHCLLTDSETVVAESPVPLVELRAGAAGAVPLVSPR